MVNHRMTTTTTSVETTIVAVSPVFRLSLAMTRRIVRRLIEAEVRQHEPQVSRFLSSSFPHPGDVESFQYSVRMLRRVVRRIIDQAPSQQLSA